MDIELIHKLGKNNFVLDALSWKEENQNEKVMNITQALITMFIGESDLNTKLREGYVNDHLALHYFDELRNKCKVKGIFLKDRLLKWKQSWMYVLVGKLCTKVLEQVHDILMARDQGEKTICIELGNFFY